jgi:hypothetical protein
MAEFIFLGSSIPQGEIHMLEPGTQIEMTKGYKRVRGLIMEKTGSEFEFYVVKLENGIHMVAGPSAFVVLEKD